MESDRLLVSMNEGSLHRARARLREQVREAAQKPRFGTEIQ